MMNHLILDEILGNLDAKTVDNFRSSNSNVRDYITKNRLRYASTEIEELRFTMFEGKIEILRPLFEDGLQFDYHAIKVNCSELPKYVHNLSPRKVEFYGDDTVREIDSRWLRRIEHVSLIDMKDENLFMKVIDMLHCSELELMNSNFEIDIDQVLEKMPYVVTFNHNNHDVDNMWSARCTQKTLELIGEKSIAGTGIRQTVIFNSKECVITQNQLIEFLKNAKFHPRDCGAPCEVILSHVTGQMSEFENRMEEEFANQGWKVMHWSNNGIGLFEMTSQFFWIKLLIHHFVEDMEMNAEEFKII